MIMQTSPFWVSIVGYIVNGEKLMAYEFVAIAANFAGVAAIILSRPQTNHNSQLFGIFLTFFAAFCAGIS
jgi:drug/metabolite transporter (DMT)-like permease